MQTLYNSLPSLRHICCENVPPVGGTLRRRGSGGMAQDEKHDAVAMAYRVFTMLETGRSSQHLAAQAMLATVDHGHLRRLIIDALAKESRPRTEDTPVRRSMLRTLGRIAADDAEAVTTLRRQLEDDESPRWLRYWTLEGLIAGKFVDL